tara:strand:- start:91 stop:312 length:222 start_codon:yes stop_codon:yes gene_type:complete
MPAKKTTAAAAQHTHADLKKQCDDCCKKIDALKKEVAALKKEVANAKGGADPRVDGIVKILEKLYGKGCVDNS